MPTPSLVVTLNQVGMSSVSLLGGASLLPRLAPDLPLALVVGLA